MHVSEITELYFYRKRQEEIDDQSYEQWLAEKTEKKPAPSQPAPKAPGGASKSSNTAAPGGSIAKDTGADSGPLTLDKIIRNIMKRRAEEHGTQDSHRLDYDSWLMKKDMDLLEQIRAGKTPLQMMLQNA